MAIHAVEAEVSPSDFDYAISRQDQQQQLRDGIFAVAARLLAEGGMEGLSVRAIAGGVGASTKVIYSHFGGKPGIVTALYSDGFSRLTEQLTAAADDDGPIVERLQRLAIAYRSFGVSSPHIYELMFGPRVRDLLPTREHRNAARKAQLAMTGLFELGQEQGTFIRADPARQARILWTVMHGTVSLELTGWFDSDEGKDRLEEVVTMVIDSQSAR